MLCIKFQQYVLYYKILQALSDVKNPSGFHPFPKPWNRNVIVSVENVTAGNFQSITCSSIYTLSCYNGLSNIGHSFQKFANILRHL